MKLFVIPCLLMAMLFAFAAIADQPPTMARDWAIKAQAVPTTATDIGALVTDGNPAPGTTLSVCQLDITVAPGSAAINVTIRDNQATPVYFLQAVPITPSSSSQGTTWPSVIRASAPLGCKQFLNGMTVQASATGVSIAASGRW
jgi:hypothetical protein